MRFSPLDLFLIYYFLLSCLVMHTGTFWQKYTLALCAYVLGIYLAYLDQMWRSLVYWQYSLSSMMFDEWTIIVILVPDMLYILRII